MNDQWMMMGLGISETKVKIFDILIKLCEKTNAPLTIEDLKYLRKRFMEELEKELSKDIPKELGDDKWKKNVKIVN